MQDEWSKRGSRPGTRLPIVVALALAVGIAVITAIVLWLRGSPAPPVAQPIPVPPAPHTPPAVFDVHPPAGSGPILWFEVAWEQVPTAIRLRAVDWDGQEVGAVALPCLAPCSYDPSPDGRHILVRAQGEPVQPATVFDVAGNRVGAVSDATASWADDSRQFCVLRPPRGSPSPSPLAASLPTEFDLVDPFLATRRVVASLSALGASTVNGRPAGWTVATCSVESDRAVLAVEGQFGVGVVRVVRLSTGATIATLDDPTRGAGCCAVSTWALNHDAGVAIENLAGGGSRVRNLLTGQSTPWPPGASRANRAMALSWNGRRALVSGIGGSAMGIITTAGGAVQWLAPSGYDATLTAARPESEDVLLLIGTPSRAASPKWVIVRADGTEVALPSELAAG